MADKENAAAYGEDAARVLRPVQNAIRDLSGVFVETFYRRLSSAALAARVFARLSADEFRRLQDRQAAYLVAILVPEITEEQHRKEAVCVGRIHAHVGVDLLWLIEAFDIYQTALHDTLGAVVADCAERERIMRVVNQRIMVDLSAQAEIFRRVESETAEAFVHIDQYAIAGANVRDTVREIMSVFPVLEGRVSAFFGRADTHGQLQIEASAGTVAEQYHQAMENGSIPKISIDADQVAGQGPGGRAWRSGQIVVTDAWALDPEGAPWWPVGQTLGFRSSAAVPILDEAGRSIALLSLYSSWPGYFSTSQIRSLLAHTQGVLGSVLQKGAQLTVVPWQEQLLHRKLIHEGRVVMLYQPIIDLRTGVLVKVEALARLELADGELIPPGRFLSSLGDAELLQLFDIGLQRACVDRRHFGEPGRPIPVAINFPAGAWGDPRYEAVLFDRLAAAACPPDQLQLEMLETDDGHAHGMQAFYQRLRDAGIRVAQDDLGSGHSSLLRLNQYLFDEVKIDQALVRDALRTPTRALEFILHISRLAHAFDIPVTVEGLAHPALIEAAAILGADHGQGHGIAHPMPASEMPRWHRNYVYPIDPDHNPLTALGAMAGFLLWDQQLATIVHQPELVDIFAKADNTVDRFIATRQLENTPLAESVHRNHHAAARNHEAYEETRAEIIATLAQYCRQEEGPA